jgi:hypothetical protein
VKKKTAKKAKAASAKEKSMNSRFSSLCRITLETQLQTLLPTGLVLGRNTQNRPSKIVCGLGNSAA